MEIVEIAKKVMNIRVLIITKRWLFEGFEFRDILSTTAVRPASYISAKLYSPISAVSK